MMKIYRSFNLETSGKVLNVSLRALFRAIGMESVVVSGAVPVDALDCIRVEADRIGETGTQVIRKSDVGITRYEVDGDTMTIYIGGLGTGISRVFVIVQYGTNQSSALIVELNVPQITDEGEYDEPSDIDLAPVDTIIAGAGGGMEQYILTIKDGKFHHDDEELDFEAVKGAVMDKSKFVYLHYANAFHLPCFIVDAAGRQSVEFTSSFVIGGQAHIERVIINEQEEIDVDNVQTLRINEDGGVAFGTSCEATSEGAFAHGYETTASGYISHAEGERCKATMGGSHAEGYITIASHRSAHAEGSHTETSASYQHAQGVYNNAADFYSETGAFMHGCGTGNNSRKNAFAIASDGSIYVIGLGGYDGTNHAQALSLQEIFGANNIQASSNTLVNGYNVPSLTPKQVTAAYNAVVAGRPVTITDATGNYHLSVMQADNLSGDLAISIIYLNVMLLTYEISGGAVDIQFKNL